MAPTHTFRFRRDKFAAPFFDWAAACSCGWRGGHYMRTERKYARRAHAEHLARFQRGRR